MDLKKSWQVMFRPKAKIKLFAATAGEFRVQSGDSPEFS